MSLVAKWKTEGRAKPTREELALQSELVRALCSRWDSLEIVGSLLYRRWGHKDNPQQTILHLVAPMSLRKQIFDLLHSNPAAGHLGITRTVERVRSRFFWPGCKGDIRQWCQQCFECARAKGGPGYRAPLCQVPVGAPLERIAIDICELPLTDRGNRYVLVLCDYWTKWVSVFALPNQTAQLCADAIVNGFITIFGVPRQIHSDQGRNFTSELFTEMSKLLGVTKTRTTPYRPQSDGMCERFNRSMLMMLRAVVNESRTDWDDWLPHVALAYNSSAHETTGLSPFKMMLGREANLPLDVMFGPPPRHSTCVTEYVEWLRQTLMKSHEYARKHCKKAALRQKRNYDSRCNPIGYEVGKFAWRWIPPGGSKKLARGWKGPYKVVGKASDINYYIKLTPDAQATRVHVDSLKPHLGQTPQAWRGHKSETEGSSSSAPASSSSSEEEEEGKAQEAQEEEEGKAPNDGPTGASSRVRSFMFFSSTRETVVIRSFFITSCLPCRNDPAIASSHV